MYRRLIYLPLILLMASLACSQFPGQLLPVSTNTQQPILVETVELPTPINFPTQLTTPTQANPLVSPTTKPAQTTQPTSDLETDNDLVDPGENDDLLYKRQPGSPALMNNIFHPGSGCNWMGVGGQVFGESGQPVGMLILEMGGSLNGEKVEALTLTGSAAQWGPGGYEFKIADMPIASTGQLWLRVLNLESIPLSEKIYFDTFENCDQNAIMVNFIHHTASTYLQLYFPVIIQDQ